MVSSWLVKLVLGIVVAGLAIIELGSPLVAKAQLDGSAHEVADEVALRVNRSTTKNQLKDLCDEEASTRSVEVLSCELVPSQGAAGVIKVEARKEARSLILKNLGATEDWYDQRITVTADVSD